MRLPTICIILATLALIAFSSTQTAGVLSSDGITYIEPRLRMAGLSIEAIRPIAEKVPHVVLFFILGAMLPWHRGPGGWKLWISLGIVAVVGIGAEVMQLFTGRDARVADAAINVLSGAAGALRFRQPRSILAGRGATRSTDSS